ncbi:hypothetical protein BDV36DRAFT_290340 [Aspergillus pseudocaelatus]|uniref:Zn(2)-C6 fungal-type domain-containing protein n=1 Tax=Aspergillus pseudocaelatus TaxID=1825620 RepID=A0ABQ6X2W8_9EURO|nr:hypothetical protein BDV36DRAFT_290340 [Aspergillus pseudocaelatus]
MDHSAKANTRLQGDALPTTQSGDHRSGLRPNRRPRKPRKVLNCEPCRQSKLRCDRQQPCSACQQRECVSECSFRRAPDTSSLVDRLTPQSVDQQQRQQQRAGPGSAAATPRSFPERPTVSQDTFSDDVSPGSAYGRWDAVLRRPSVDQIDTISALEDLFVPSSAMPAMPKERLLNLLPSDSCCDYLLSEYFSRLSPLFHILHGPTFQAQYARFLQDRGRTSFSWLSLLFMICSVTLNTMDSGDPFLIDFCSGQPHSETQFSAVHRFRKAALTCLAQDRFLVHHDLNTLESILILIYTVSHNEGVERGWVLLGMALNMGVALRCNVDSADRNCIERERHRRCWAGILMLHTYQAILFRDIDMSFLLRNNATMPMEVNDVDVLEDRVWQPKCQPTQMSLMSFKLRLFRLSTEVCCHISGPSKLNQDTLQSLDNAIAEEQTAWASLFLVDGAPSLLDHASYAYWCILETYAHQLYLLLHRPFHHSQSSNFLIASRERCLSSSTALLDLHRQFCELPRLRNFKWLVNGMTSLNALHGAVALASCLLGISETTDLSQYWNQFYAAVRRIEGLQDRSPVCAKAFPFLQKLQNQILLADTSPGTGAVPNGNNRHPFDDWIEGVDWFNFESSNFHIWDEILTQAPS